MGALRLVPINVSIYPNRKMYLASLAGMKPEGERKIFSLPGNSSANERLSQFS